MAQRFGLLSGSPEMVSSFACHRVMSIRVGARCPTLRDSEVGNTPCEN